MVMQFLWLRFSDQIYGLRKNKLNSWETKIYVFHSKKKEGLFYIIV